MAFTPTHLVAVDSSKKLVEELYQPGRASQKHVKKKEFELVKKDLKIKATTQAVDRLKRECSELGGNSLENITRERLACSEGKKITDGYFNNIGVGAYIISYDGDLVVCETGLSAECWDDSSKKNSLLKICNDHNERAEIALLKKSDKNGHRASSGWYIAEGNQCVTINLGKYSNPIWLFASTRSGIFWYSKDKQDPVFCVNRYNKFEYFDYNRCEDENKVRGFQVRLNEGKTTVHRLTN